MSWNRMKSLIADMQKRQARARSIAARNREMPKIREILGMRPCYNPPVRLD